MNTLGRYQKQALKLAEIVELDGNEGYVARIPGFRGLLGTGNSKKEALRDLEGALTDWVDLALKLGHGLPKLAPRPREVANAR